MIMCMYIISNIIIINSSEWISDYSFALVTFKLTLANYFLASYFLNVRV